MIGLLMFVTGLIMLLIGFPVAFTFGAVSVFFGITAGVIEALSNGDTLLQGLNNGQMMFAMMPHRIKISLLHIQLQMILWVLQCQQKLNLARQ